MGVPRAIVGGTRTHEPTPRKGTRQSHRWKDAPRTSTPTPPRRAEGQRQFSHRVGTFLAQAPRRGGGGCRAVGKRESRPKRRAAAPTALLGQVGTSLALWRGGAGANPLSLWNAKPRPRRDWDEPPATPRTSPTKRKGRTTRLAPQHPRQQQDNLEPTTCSPRA